MKVEHSATLANASLAKEVRGAFTRKAETASEEVQLSSLASQLLATENEAPFDAKNVEEIKQAIAAGKFSIDAEAIADRIIASAKELLTSQQGS